MKKFLIICAALVTMLVSGCASSSAGLTTTDKFIGEFNRLVGTNAQGVSIGAAIANEPFAVSENIFVALQKNSSGSVQEVLVVLRPNQTGFDGIAVQEAVTIFKQAIRAVFPNVTVADTEKIASDLGLNEPIAQWTDRDAYFDEPVTFGDGQFYRQKLEDGSFALIIGGKGKALSAAFKKGEGVISELVRSELPKANLFSMTPAQFKQKFNAACVRDTNCHFRMANERYVSGDVQDVVQAFFTERVMLMLTVHKSGKLREVAIVVAPSGDDSVDAENLLLARDVYYKAIATDGLATADDVAKIQDTFGLANPVFEWLIGTSTATGGKLYSTVTLPIGVAFCIGEQ